ncbi:MAG: SPFH domain-containing protein [Elusimicrobia bacterium]|nr:SPFH domain-containing protein [Elusimicrobiota bacterium]
MEERKGAVLNGWLMLSVVIVLWLAVPLTFAAAAGAFGPQNGWLAAAAMLLVIVAALMSNGLFTLQPNEARVLVLFGEYTGTVKDSGFHWANPFSVHRDFSLTLPATQKGEPMQHIGPKRKYRISLRARNFETPALKVNDQRGNPIEIGAVIVWRVSDTVKAFFDVDEYEDYVHVQSETAVRHLATSYPYDHAEGAAQAEVTLRGNSAEVSAALERELRERLARAGVVVEEARLTHLAYSPEIAHAMLRRQQAEAIIAARQKIVQGAVSMVEMALTELSQRKVVQLDEERKAAMVGNLLVVLCGMSDAEPIINAGTLYH